MASRMLLSRGVADAARMIEIGGPISGGPIMLELAASILEDPSNTTAISQEDLLEAGLKELIGPHNGLFMGPILIGFRTDIFLAGIMLKQLTLWWKYAREDRLFIKIIIAWCTVFGIIGTIFNLAFCFHIFVYNYGSSWLGLISPLTSAGVQLFYCDRAYKLSGRNKVLALTILSAILLSVIGGIGSKITTVSNADPSKARLATTFIYLLTAGAMVADFIITAAILWCLARSKSGWNVTDKVVSKLLAISAESQLPPTLLAMVFLIIFAYKTTKAAANPTQVVIDVTSNLTIFFMMVIPKTYIVGFIAVLNARTALRAVFTSSHEASSGRRKQTTDFPLSVRRGGESRGVRITTETYTKNEPTSPVKAFSSHLAAFSEGRVQLDDEESLRRIGGSGSEAGSKTGLTWIEPSRD
uniref:DUF6534 domain-containing protein n=1 Tax=Kwoniella dejecticola CBS 10117 TaxID=1296121 RepID=A0A1A6A928_9TREE|nr:uncharacterized protein I303_02569 [Kwoniella dejecticola CBS 10117]OBR86561.1 hypothetical protein I303_02569 [Kwoniella dejecticola CBS 10117]